jgi:hypothetical protein
MQTLSLLCVLHSGILLSWSQRGGEDPELAAAREMLGSPEEQDCRAGAEICVRRNDVAAVELLLDIASLESDRAGYLPSAHYRDIAWEGLGRMSSLVARQRLAEELRMNKTSRWMRAWCAELLGGSRDAACGPALEGALDDDDIMVRRAAALALSSLRDATAAKALAKRVEDGDRFLRTYAIEALARIDPAANRALYQQGLADEDGGVRCALLGIARELYPEEAEQLATAALADGDWRPRMRAVEELGELRTKSAVDALLHALDDGRPAVVARANEQLQRMTGEAHTIAYHDIPLVSDHVAFLIDRSRGMTQTLSSCSRSKEEAALAELGRVLDGVGDGFSFDVLCYAETVESLGENRPLELTGETREKALRFVSESPRGSSRDIWKLLEAVLSDPDIDTAYLLSSGEPDTGTYVHTNRLVPHLRELNRFHGLVVHVIAFSGNASYRRQLQAIAEATGGEFRSFE